MKFKVGDKVKVIGKDGYTYFDKVKGKIGIITSVHNRTEWPYYFIVGEDEFCGDENEIELIGQQQMLFPFMYEKVTDEV